MLLKSAILLDSNAGAPLHPVVKQALFAFLESEASTGNPQSLHAFGRKASALIGDAEAAVLGTFGVSPLHWRVTFTGSGSEANQLAIRSALGPALEQGTLPTWAVSEVEHGCVLGMIPEMKARGVKVHPLRPRATGEVNDLSGIGGASLLSVIGVGNETGIFQHNITSHILQANFPTLKNRPPYHADFTAGWGKKKLDLSKVDAPDFVAIAGHKLGGISGIGALIHRRSIRVERAGTPNLAGIVAMKALADHWAEITGEMEKLRDIREAFERELLARFPKILITGSSFPRAANVTHFIVPGLRKDLSLVAQLDLRGFAVSAGSACASHVPEPSHVLRAMGVSGIDARNALRVSLHPGNTAEDLTRLLDALGAILGKNEAL